MPWTCGKNTCPSRYTFFGKGCKRILFRGLERATWTGYSNSKNRPLTLFEKEYYDPPPAYRRRPEITRMEAQTASARGYLKLPGRHPFPAAGGQRKGTSLRMSLSFGTPEGIRTSDLPLRRRLRTLFIRNRHRLKTIDITGFFQVSLFNKSHHILLISVVF